MLGSEELLMLQNTLLNNYEARLEALPILYVGEKGRAPTK
jgi:hypothetical protein